MGEFQAFDAIGPDPGMKLLPGELLKAKAPKKIEAIGEHEDLLEPQGASLLQATLDQAAADALSLAVRRDHDGTDFSQILPKYMQRRDPQDVSPAFLPENEIIPHKAVEFGQGTGQDVPLAGP